MKHNTQKIFLIIWIIVIFVLTGYPALETPKIKHFPIDKFYHFLVFFILGVLLMRFFKGRKFFLVGCGIALLAELQQIFLPGRNFEIFDILAGIFGLVVIFLILKLARSNKNGLSKA